MAWTLTELAALQAAIKSGALRVQYEDRAVTYRSLDELKQLEVGALAELGIVKGGPVRMRAATSKDLDPGACDDQWIH